MKALIWFLCCLAFALVKVMLELNGITLGVIPVVILFGATLWTARRLCALWDDRSDRKNETQNIGHSFLYSTTSNPVTDIDSAPEDGSEKSSFPTGHFLLTVTSIFVLILAIDDQDILRKLFERINPSVIYFILIGLHIAYLVTLFSASKHHAPLIRISLSLLLAIVTVFAIIEGSVFSYSYYAPGSKALQYYADIDYLTAYNSLWPCTTLAIFAINIPGSLNVARTVWYSSGIYRRMCYSEVASPHSYWTAGTITQEAYQLGRHEALKNIPGESGYDAGIYPTESDISIPERSTGDPLLRTIILIFVAILLFLIGGIIAVTISKNTPNSNTSTRESISGNITTQAPTRPSSLTAQSRPMTGQSFQTPSGRCVAPLTVKASGSSDYYIVIKSQTSVMNTAGYYVRAGGTLSVDIPLGTYEIYYATGNTWYGRNNLFGPDTVYQKCEGSFSFTEDVNGYNGWTLTLYPTFNGNMDTDIIDADDFPK